jgi:hypothetical protein
MGGDAGAGGRYDGDCGEAELEEKEVDSRKLKGKSGEKDNAEARRAQSCAENLGARDEFFASLRMTSYLLLRESVADEVGGAARGGWVEVGEDDDHVA